MQIFLNEIKDHKLLFNNKYFQHFLKDQQDFEKQKEIITFNTSTKNASYLNFNSWSGIADNLNALIITTY